MDLKDLLTYQTPEEKERKRLEMLQEKLTKKLNWLSEEERGELLEGLFMEFISGIEHHITTFIETNKTIWFNADNDEYKKVANRCFKKIIESKERNDTQQGEKEFMIMFVKAMGQVINDTYNIKKIYFDKE